MATASVSMVNDSTSTLNIAPLSHNLTTPVVIISSTTNKDSGSYRKDSPPMDPLKEEQRKREWLLKRKCLARKIPVGVSMVIDGFLYLGSGKDAKDTQKLLDLKITHVLNCALEWKPRLASPFVYKTSNVLDKEDQDLTTFFREGIAFIDQARSSTSGRILVHCVVGKSRSPTVTIAYLMSSLKMSLKQAFQHVKDRRSLIMPNDGFMKQLMDFEMQLFGLSQSSMLWGEWKNLSKCALTPTSPVAATLSPSHSSPPSLSATLDLSPDLSPSLEPPAKKSTHSSLSPSSSIEAISLLDLPTPMPPTPTTVPPTPTTVPPTPTTITNSTPMTNISVITTAALSPSKKIKPQPTPLQKAALNAFVQTYVTPEFLLQGVQEVCGDKCAYDSKSLGEVLLWVNNNIRASTSSAESLRMEGVSWKQISRFIDKSSKHWLRGHYGMNVKEVCLDQAIA